MDDPLPAERPPARARSIPEERPELKAPREPFVPDEPASVRNRPAEFTEMVAPVEMWFGDYRVGVKAGSKTHARFRKYADVLLAELKDDGKRVR